METWGAAIPVVSVSNGVVERGGEVLGEENSLPQPLFIYLVQGVLAQAS